MPQAIPVIVGLVMAWAGASSVAIAAAMFVASAFVMYATRESGADDVAAEGRLGNKVNTRSTQERIQVIYGKQRVGGNDVYLTTTEEDNDYLWAVTTLAEGECNGIAQNADGVDEAYLSDKLYTEYIVGGDPQAKYWFHGGSPTQTVDTNIGTSEWTDCLRNTCYIVWRLTWNETLFQGFPVRFVTVEGKKLYDFRDGPQPCEWHLAISWATGNQWGTVKVYSTNPVLALYDWMSNDRYGMGIEYRRFDITTWATAANYCDSKGWTINMVISQNKGQMDVAREILSHFRGVLVWYNGQFFLRYADLNVESSLMTIEDEHIVQDENGRASIGISESSIWQIPDGVRVRFVDATKDYTEDDVLIGDDNGVIRQYDLPGCTDRQIALDMAVYFLERTKLSRKVKGVFRGDCLQLEPHDVVTLTSSAIGVSGQLMRVEEANIIRDNLVELALAYEDVSLYDDDYDTDLDNIYTCSLPDPRGEPPSVRNVEVTEEQYNYRLRTFTRLIVTFDPPLNYPYYQYVEVYLSRDDIAWEHLLNANTDFEIANIAEDDAVYLRLKVVNIFGGKQSDANDYRIYYAVVGYTDEPESLWGLWAIVNQNTIDLYSEKVEDPDVELYEFRLGGSWNSGLFLAALRSPNYSLYGVRPGSHTFWADTLGNNGYYGAVPVSATAEVGVFDDPDWLPDGMALIASESIDTLITNGTMEADANWATLFAVVNVRSDTEVYEGDYSRYIEMRPGPPGDIQGIQSAVFSTVAGQTYGWSARVFPDLYVKWNSEAWDTGVQWGHPLRSTRTAVWARIGTAPRPLWQTNIYNSSFTWSNNGKWQAGVLWEGTTVDRETQWATRHTQISVWLVSGSGIGWDKFDNLSQLTDGEWNLIYGTYTAKETGAAARIQFAVTYPYAGNYYIDNVALMKGTFSNACPVLYSGKAYVAGRGTGTYLSPIFDRSASARYCVYVETSITVEGYGTAWSDIFDTHEKWPAAGTKWRKLLPAVGLDNPSVEMSLLYGESSPPTEEVGKMEICSAIVTARYYQIQIDIINPNTMANAMVEAYKVQFCQ